MFLLTRLLLPLVALLATASFATPVPADRTNPASPPAQKIVLKGETYHLGRLLPNRGDPRAVYRITDGKVTFTGKLAKEFQLSEERLYTTELVNTGIVLGAANVKSGEAKINGAGDARYFIITQPPTGCTIEECRELETLKKKNRMGCIDHIQKVLRPAYIKALKDQHKLTGQVHLMPNRENVIWDFKITKVNGFINFGSMGAIGGPEYKKYMQRIFPAHVNSPMDIDKFAELNANHWYHRLLCSMNYETMNPFIGNGD